LADKYDKEEEEAAAAAAATLPPQQPWKDLIHMAFSTTTNSSETSSILGNSTHSSLPPQQPWKDLIHMAFSTTTIAAKRAASWGTAQIHQRPSRRFTTKRTRPCY
jgi:hypothetical protein